MHTGGRAKIFHRNWWVKKYKSVSSRLKRTKETTTGVLNRPSKPINGFPSRDPQERLRNAFTVANNAFVFKFPTNFVASEGVDFENLLIMCDRHVRSIDPTRPKRRKCISSLEVWSFLVSNRHDRNHIAYKFRKYSEEEVRVLPLKLLDIDPVPNGLAKAVTKYGGFNSEEHRLVFKEIGYERSNIVDWFSLGLEKMCCSTISTFELFSNGGINLSYNVAAEVLNLNNRFQTNLVNMKIVISYSPKSLTRSLTSNAYLTTGKVVTTFIQTLPFDQYEKDCILNPAPNTLPWGGSQTAFSSYLNRFGKNGLLFGANGLPLVGATGLPIITVGAFFPVLPTEREGYITDANVVEDNYNKNNLDKISRSTTQGIADIKTISKGYRLIAEVDLRPESTKIDNRHKNFLNELKRL